MKELIQALINQGIITATDIQRMTTLELLLTIVERVNELHGLTKEGLESVQQLLDKGVQEEVIAKLDEWTQDGTFDRLINESALKTVNDRIDETNAQLSVVTLSFLPQIGETNNECLIRLINELGATGGKIKFPSGVFEFEPFSIPSYILIEGNSGYTTSIVQKANTNGDLITLENVQSCGMRDIRLDCNKKNGTNGNGLRINTSLGDANHGSNLILQNLTISNANKSGVVVERYCWTFRMSDIKIFFAEEYGILNKSSDNEYAGIYIEGCKKGAIYNSGSNNRFIGGKWYINGDINDGNSYSVYECGERNQYVGVEIQESIFNGVLIKDAFLNQFVGCLVDGCGTLNGDGAVDAVGVDYINAHRCSFNGIISNQSYTESQKHQKRGISVDSSSRDINLDVKIDYNRIITPYTISDDARNINYSDKAVLEYKITDGLSLPSNSQTRIIGTTINRNRIIDNNSSNHIQVVDDGYYLIEMCLVLNSSASNITLEVTVAVNTTSKQRLFNGTISNGDNIIASCVVKANAGDTLQIYAQPRSSSQGVVTMAHNMSKVNIYKL